MPRDLESEKATLDTMPPLTKEPEAGAPPARSSTSPDSGNRRQYRDESKMNELHPYCQALTINDLESCVHLENVTFPPHEAASREKFIYRLTTCPEITLGLFTSATPNSNSPTLSTLSREPFSHPADSTDPSRKSILLAHCIATKSTRPTVTDSDMAVPPKWETSPHANPELGHNEEGRTICLHSLAVLPQYQNMGLGRTVVLAFVQRMQSAGMADRVALLAHGQLVPFYERLGFEDLGASKVEFGGGGWNDMVIEFKNMPKHG